LPVNSLQLPKNLHFFLLLLSAPPPFKSSGHFPHFLGRPWQQAEAHRLSFFRPSFHTSRIPLCEKLPLTRRIWLKNMTKEGKKKTSPLIRLTGRLFKAEFGLEGADYIAPSPDNCCHFKPVIFWSNGQNHIK
jgi:hypothetical protein